MLKHLKLYKALYLIGIGVFVFAGCMLVRSNKMAFNFLLGFSGAMFIVGAIMLLYPILFAKKADSEGKEVKLKVVEIHKNVEKTN